MDEIATHAMRSYRELIDDAGFWPFYLDVTPVRWIAELPIGSRPASRTGGGDPEFGSLRAIPWVFSWNQIRALVPGWFGCGTALTGIDSAELSALYRDWPFFQAVVDNAERELARARLPIARSYVDGLGTAGDRAIFARIENEFTKAVEAIAGIKGGVGLLDDSPVIQKSIRLRNPYTDVLNVLQIELLQRGRSAEDPARYRDAVFVSLNGVAAAMQSTG